MFVQVTLDKFYLLARTHMRAHTHTHTTKNCCESGVIAIDYSVKALLSSWESEEGEKVTGKIIRVFREHPVTFVRKSVRRKAPSTSYPASCIFRERRWLHILRAGQTIYDSNDPGRNNWNRNKRKHDLLCGLPFVPTARIEN